MPIQPIPPRPYSMTVRVLSGINALVLLAAVVFLCVVSAVLSMSLLGGLMKLRFSVVPFAAVPLSVAVLLLWWLIKELRISASIALGQGGRRLPSVAGPVCVVLMGLLAYGACRKLHQVIKPSEAKATKGNLGAIRSALSIYYGDMEGVYPEDPAVLTVNGKYMSTIPRAKTIHHKDSADIVLYPDGVSLDTGGWGYVNDPDSSNMGSLFIDCTHTDMRGRVWTEY